MDKTTQIALTKVPELTLGFWIIKILATTLGETGGDAVSMSMHLGYLISTIIFAAIFLLAVAAQIKAKQFQPILYWTTIIATDRTAFRPTLRSAHGSALQPADSDAIPAT